MAGSISETANMLEDLTGELRSISSVSWGFSKRMEELKRRAQQLGKEYVELSKKSLLCPEVFPADDDV